MRTLALTLVLLGLVWSAALPVPSDPGPQPAGPRLAMDVRLRPTTPGAEDAFSVPESQRYAVDTPHFRIHYTDRGEDAATTRFVKDAWQVLEYVWAIEIDHLGWPAPQPDEGLGGDDRLDVYLVDLDDGPYGYVAADEENACVACRSVHGYLVLENDYAGYDPNPPDALRSTAAHEFSHLVHMGMAWDAEPWAYEATAVWMERMVFPDSDARTPYLEDFADHPSLSMTDFGESSGGFDRAYGAYVWNVWLSERYGPELILRTWQTAADDDAHILAGYAEVLAEEGTSLDEEFLAFTAATTTWEVSGFPAEPQPYPPVARAGTLASGDVVEIQVDHSGAWVVDLDVGDATTVTVRGPMLVAGGIAVTATGGTEAVAALDPTLWDSRAQVTLDGIGDAGRVTLVVANADATLARPKRLGDDRAHYLREDITYVVGIDADPGVPPK